MDGTEQQEDVRIVSAQLCRDLWGECQRLGVSRRSPYHLVGHPMPNQQTFDALDRRLNILSTRISYSRYALENSRT
jgi:hypothetical protein